MALLCALVNAPGCGTDKRPERREFERLSKRIDDIRNADNSTKKLYLDALRQEECEAFCGLRERCREAYRLHIDALGAIERAQKTAPERASAQLDEATRLLKQARQQTTACAAEQGQVARRLRP